MARIAPRPLADSGRGRRLAGRFRTWQSALSPISFAHQELLCALARGVDEVRATSHRQPPVAPDFRPHVMCGWPPAGKGFFARVQGAASCGHVYGLFARHTWPLARMGPVDRGPIIAAGSKCPDDGRRVTLDRRIDRHCHHACFTLASLLACRTRLLRPTPASSGSPPGAPSAPSRCAPSCWRARPPPLCAAWWRAALSARDHALLVCCSAPRLRR